eukprot:1518478-Pyramimonas_sp.AAC.1
MRGPRGPRELPRELQESHRRPPRVFQEGQNRVLGRPKRAPRRPKTAPTGVLWSGESPGAQTRAPTVPI